MAKEKAVKVETPVVPAERTLHFFPRLLFLFSLVVIALAVVDYFRFYSVSAVVIDMILFVSGIWMFMLALERGWYERRKSILKRYI